MISKNLKILKKIIKNYYIKTKIINEIEQHNISTQKSTTNFINFIN